MKKLAKLALLAILPLGLIACDDKTSEDNGEIIDNAIGQWTETDIESFALLNKDVVFPYDKEVFKAYEVETVDENGDPVKRIDANYSIFFDYDIRKIILNLTSEEENVIDSYVTFATSDESWSLDSTLSNGGKRLVNKLSDTNFYYIDVLKASDTDTLFVGYTQTRMTFNNVDKAYKFINEDAFFFEKGEKPFVAPKSKGISTVALSDGYLNGLYYVDLTITSSDNEELSAFKTLLSESGYKLDKAYEDEKRVNYYLIDEFDGSKRCKDIYLDKEMHDSTFTLRLSLSLFA